MVKPVWEASIGISEQCDFPQLPLASLLFQPWASPFSPWAWVSQLSCSGAVPRITPNPGLPTKTKHMEWESRNQREFGIWIKNGSVLIILLQ